MQHCRSGNVQNHSLAAVVCELSYESGRMITVKGSAETSTKGTMDPEGSARNSCNSWPLYAHWLAVTAVACTPTVYAN